MPKLKMFGLMGPNRAYRVELTVCLATAGSTARSPCISDKSTKLPMRSSSTNKSAPNYFDFDLTGDSSSGSKESRNSVSTSS